MEGGSCNRDVERAFGEGGIAEHFGGAGEVERVEAREDGEEDADGDGHLEVEGL